MVLHYLPIEGQPTGPVRVASYPNSLQSISGYLHFLQFRSFIALASMRNKTNYRSFHFNPTWKFLLVPRSCRLKSFDLDIEKLRFARIKPRSFPFVFDLRNTFAFFRTQLAFSQLNRGSKREADIPQQSWHLRILHPFHPPRSLTRTERLLIQNHTLLPNPPLPLPAPLPRTGTVNPKGPNFRTPRPAYEWPYATQDSNYIRTISEPEEHGDRRSCRSYRSY